jgi:hypothetical protein
MGSKVPTKGKSPSLRERGAQVRKSKLKINLSSDIYEYPKIFSPTYYANVDKICMHSS